MKVWGINHCTLIHVDATDEGLEITADVGDTETTVVLEDTAVKKLRLALQRYERTKKTDY